MLSDIAAALELVSTGLRYLIVAELGAQYAYLLDADTGEGRHWNNDGGVRVRVGGDVVLVGSGRLTVLPS